MLNPRNRRMWGAIFLTLIIAVLSTATYVFNHNWELNDKILSVKRENSNWSQYLFSIIATQDEVAIQQNLKILQLNRTASLERTLWPLLEELEHEKHQATFRENLLRWKNTTQEEHSAHTLRMQAETNYTIPLSSKMDELQKSTRKKQQRALYFMTLAVVLLILLLFLWLWLDHKNARTDQRTDLLNQFGFEEALGPKQTVLAVGIDSLSVLEKLYSSKTIEATYQTIATSLKALIGRKGERLAFNGKTFLIAIDADSPPLTMGGLIIDRLNTLIKIDRENIDISVSVGSATAQKGDMPSETIRNATEALHLVQNHPPGGSQAYDAKEGQSTLRAAEIMRDLKTEEKDGFPNFKLHFQPQVDPTTRTLVGHEALVRWLIKGKARAFPDELIALAIANGTIHVLGKWILKTACEQGKAWLDMGLPPIEMSVNFAPIQFLGKDIVNEINQICDGAGLPRCLLNIEVTEESITGRQKKIIIPILEALRAAGYSIHLDDFGKGSAVLDHLMAFGVSTVKLDREFIIKTLDDESCKIMILHVVQMALNLKLKIVAEGVDESMDKLVAYLIEIGVPIIQGYFYCRPLPPEKVILFWEENLILQLREKRLSSEQLKNYSPHTEALATFLAETAEC